MRQVSDRARTTTGRLDNLSERLSLNGKAGHFRRRLSLRRWAAYLARDPPANRVGWGWSVGSSKHGQWAIPDDTTTTIRWPSSCGQVSEEV